MGMVVGGEGELVKVKGCFTFELMLVQVLKIRIIQNDSCTR